MFGRLWGRIFTRREDGEGPVGRASWWLSTRYKAASDGNSSVVCVINVLFVVCGHISMELMRFVARFLVV